MLVIFIFLAISSHGQSISTEFYKLYNEYRAEHQLTILEVDSSLEAAASYHSMYLMMLNNSGKVTPFYISHYEENDVDSITEYFSPSDRVKAKSTLRRYHTGENLTGFYGKYFDSGDEILQMWINSSVHNEILLSPKNGKMGLGIVEGVINGRKSMIATLVVTD